MPSWTVGPRVEFSTDHYPRIRVWDPKAGHDRYVYLHRATAYAHGIIDDLWEPVDVHHTNVDRWTGCDPDVLEARSREEHAEEEPHVANLK